MSIRVASLLLAAGLMWAVPGRAQKRFQAGYLVLERGDTLRGLVEAPTRNTVSQGAFFKKSAAGPEPLFYPVQALRSLHLADGKAYMVHKMQPVMSHDTLRMLLETLVLGRVNLYRSPYNAYINNAADNTANQLTFKYYYVGRASEPNRRPYLLQSSTFRADMRSLFSDCPTAPAITGQFTEENIRRLVQQYNACPTRLTP